MATLTMTDGIGAVAHEVRADLKTRLLAYERELITAALSETGGNQRQAAHRLGVLPTTLHEKMKRLGLRAEAFAAPAGRADSESEAAAGDGHASRSVSVSVHDERAC